MELKNRWASCSEKGNLNFHWKCIMAPSDVLSYIVAHELVHLVQKIIQKLSGMKLTRSCRIFSDILNGCDLTGLRWIYRVLWCYNIILVSLLGVNEVRS